MPAAQINPGEARVTDTRLTFNTLPSCGIAHPNRHLRALKHDHPGSRSEYKKLFAAWKDADKDLSLLKQARAECARLK